MSDDKNSQPLSCAVIDKTTIPINAAKTHIGTNYAYPEERRRAVQIDDYNIDNIEVTNGEFRRFIDATGYVTTAEKPQPGSNQPGGAVFKQPTDSNPNWWQFIEGANWKHPEGPDTNIDGQDHYPVVQVSLLDAKAYAKWAGRALPTEAQWEYAARAGSTNDYIWGDQRAPNGIEQANTWQGAFPVENIKADGYHLRAPVGCYAPNGYSLYDMIGNVWEWTVTDYTQTQTPNSYTIKGGSFLCAPNYCARYRAPARQSQEADFSTNHIGFRTVSK
jgi:formylglycine-generating enzyme required for sulfatase activity